jgi:acetylornithine deacetylase/succinyl-diaminopimelate desuccinylase-like protein
MKASLSAYVFALKAIKESGINLDGRLILEFVVDEEPGAFSDLGTKYLLSRGIKAKAAIIAEPGPQIGIGHRGGYRFKLTTFGEAIHTGVSAWQKGEKGRSAILDMMKVINALKGIDIPHKPSRIFSGKKPMMTFPTMIKGGTSINSVPDECVAYGDVRLMPGNSNKQVRILIEEKLSSIEGLKYTIDDLLYVPSVEIDEKEEIVEVLDDQYKTITKTPPTIEGVGPWNDAWMLVNNDIPTITQVPLKGGGAHGKDEWVDLKSLQQLTEILARTAVSYLGTRRKSKK